MKLPGDAADSVHARFEQLRKAAAAASGGGGSGGSASAHERGGGGGGGGAVGGYTGECDRDPVSQKPRKLGVAL